MLVSQFKDPHRKYPSKLHTVQYKQKLIVAISVHFLFMV